MIIKQIDPNQTVGRLHRALVDALAEICYLDVREKICTCRNDICDLRHKYGYQFAVEVRESLVQKHPEVEQME
jgi:hypothetical protein